MNLKSNGIRFPLVIFLASILSIQAKAFNIDANEVPVISMVKLELQNTMEVTLDNPISNISDNKENRQGEIKITGTVSDYTGELLPGVVIAIKGTAKGTTTNENGEYSIVVPDENTILQFSYVGYKTQEITVENRKIISIVMNPLSEELSEVTVVAFGKQKKESVIGSITTVKPGDLKIPSSNLTTALAGNIAGVIAYQRSGEPGRDNADFFVRGITTFGTNTNPLILIDGIELTTTDLARLQPDDIESFSIMKDATATALYGARGANGVVLVTTKQGGEGPAKISLRLENSISSPTRNVDVADPITYMQLYNEAMLTRNPSGGIRYSEEKIANTMAGMNPLIYPANNWRKMLFKDNTMNQRVNLSVQGGGAIAKYYVAASLNKDNGVLKVDKRNNFNNNIDIKNYSLRANVNINLTKSTELIVRLNGNFDDYSGPLSSGTDMYYAVMRSNPVLFPAFYPVDKEHQHVRHIMFGNYDQGGYYNPYAEMVKGYREENRSQMLAQLELKQDLKFITEGLSLKGLVNITRTSKFDVSRFYNPFYYRLGSYNRATGEYTIAQINNDGTEYLGYNEGRKDLNSTMYFEGTLNYVKAIDEKNDVSGLLVGIARESQAANAGDLQLSLPSRNLGVSGRFTYSFDKRYYAEFNFGLNGTERFYKNNRFGFFPSAGVAWRVSCEKFWEPISNVVSNLKLRYSYGLVGNDQIGTVQDRFFYLSNVNMNNESRGASFGYNWNSSLNGITVSRYSNKDITWETATKQNYAIELGLFNKINIIAEYFTEYRKKILMTREAIPTTMGTSAVVRANLGEASGQGVDITMDYQQVWNKDLWSSVRGNFTYATSKYEKYEEPEYDEPWRFRKGNSIHQMYGYISERLFIDDNEAANSPEQLFGGEYGGGDIKYTDVNRDGKITEADMVPIGYPTVPEIVYGIGFSLGYKNMDISAMFQGTARQSFWLNVTGDHSTYPFIGETQLLQAYADSHWSESNRDIYATWPRLSTIQIPNNVQTSTWFMRNGNFLRLKQLEVGYTLPEKLSNKIGAKHLRVYGSGSNLLLFSKFKLWDVEMAGNGLGYPIQRVFNLGINVTF